MLGLFDRPADEKALAALLKSPAIPGLTESLIDLSPPAWRTTIAKLGEEQDSSLGKIRIILGVSIPILSFANTLANIFGVNKRMYGRNVIDGSFIIIEGLRHSCRIVSGRWSRFFFGSHLRLQCRSISRGAP
jgi:hypothetical protein